MEQLVRFFCNLALVRPRATNTRANRGSAEPRGGGAAFPEPKVNSWFAADKPGDPMSWFNSLNLSVPI